MSQISRLYTFTDGTTAYGSQVEYEIGNIVSAFNNQDSGSNGWTVVKSSLFNAADGSVSAPTYSFTNETTTGFYRAASNQLALAIAGTNYYNWTSSSFYPGTNGSQNLGSGSAKWGAIYATSAVISGDISSTGNITSTGTSSSILINNTSNSISVTSTGGSAQSITVQNSKTMTVTFSQSYNLVVVSGSSGAACAFFTTYDSSTITFFGVTSTGFAATNSPSSSQLGIYKSGNSHVISFVSGSSLASTFSNISIHSVTSAITSCTNWA